MGRRFDKFARLLGADNWGSKRDSPKGGHVVIRLPFPEALPNPPIVFHPRTLTTRCAETSAITTHEPADIESIRGQSFTSVWIDEIGVFKREDFEKEYPSDHTVDAFGSFSAATKRDFPGFIGSKFFVGPGSNEIEERILAVQRLNEVAHAQSRKELLNHPAGGTW